MLLSPQATQKIEFLTYDQGQPLPLGRIVWTIYRSMRSRRLDKVAVMADAEILKQLKPLLDAQYLEPDENFHWSGTQRNLSLRKERKRIQLGDYEAWFRWFMAHQRFRAFHTVVMVEPSSGLRDGEQGGYIDGLIARLATKVIHKVVVVKTAQQLKVNAAAGPYVEEALLALLYGTRLSMDELMETARQALVPLGEDFAIKDLVEQRMWLFKRHHSRYQLTETGEKFVEGMAVPKRPSGLQPAEVEHLFRRRRRSGPRYTLPKEVLEKMLLDDATESGWITAYGEWTAMHDKIRQLNQEEGSVTWRFFQSQGLSNKEVSEASTPSPLLLRKLLNDLAAEDHLERRTWFREVGRPTVAYFLPGKAPFLESRCGQCAFYVSQKRRCRLWWLVNKKQPFFDERWKQPGSTVTRFELHKMRWASRIGPHSSACLHFIDKKRDHNRKQIPAGCEVCGRAIRPNKGGREATCGTCRTRYARFGGKVKVLTAYEHEYEKLYHGITGGDAETDLEAWRKELREKLPSALQQKELEDLDVLADEEEIIEPPRVWRKFDPGLQEKVDKLAATTDITKRFSMAMAESSRNATLRLMEIAGLPQSAIRQAVAIQEKYIGLIEGASQSQLLTYEALIMKEYWRCYGVALKLGQQWFGPRKRSRFVREFVEDPAGRARGYSPADAAINYLHQRRLRQAKRINAEIGFPGTSDGFLHKERYNSRGVGLLFDLIDPFKFADREFLLIVVLNGGISWRDFKLEHDRRGSTFYYPSQDGKRFLDRVGHDADESVVVYRGDRRSLLGAYKESATCILGLLNAQSSELDQVGCFVYEVP